MICYFKVKIGGDNSVLVFTVALKCVRGSVSATGFIIFIISRVQIKCSVHRHFDNMGYESISSNESSYLLEHGESECIARHAEGNQQISLIAPSSGHDANESAIPSWRRYGFITLTLAALSCLAVAASYQAGTPVKPLAFVKVESETIPTGWFSTKAPTAKPSASPTFPPTSVPTVPPTAEPSALPTFAPSSKPSMKPTLQPTKPTNMPTPTPNPTIAQTTCSPLGPKAYAGYTLVSSTASGHVYSGVYGWNEYINVKGRKDSQKILVGVVYYSTDGGNTINALTEANACAVRDTRNWDVSLAGMAATEDSTYSYVWYVCNPYMKWSNELITAAGYFAAGVCRVPLSGSGANECISYQQYSETAFPGNGFYFTAVKSLSTSGDGSVAAILSNTRGLVICSKDSQFTTVSCGLKSISAYGDVALDSTGTKILAAPETDFNLKYGLVADNPDSYPISGWSSTAKLVGKYKSAASWSSCVSSDDFKILACSQAGGYVYVSRDSGLSWTASAQAFNFLSLAITSSGASFAGGGIGDYNLALSTDGLVWTAQSSCVSDKVFSVALASSGSVYFTKYTNTVYQNKYNEWVYYAAYSMYKSVATYTIADSSTADSTDDSSDDAATDDWTWVSLEASAATSYASACVSGDGTVIAAVVGDGTLKISTDGGESWSEDASAGKTVDWTDIIASSDGSTIVAVSTDGVIYTSNDTGSTFSQSDAPSDVYLSVKCSADGKNVLAGSANDVYISADAGASFASVGMSTLVESNSTAGYYVAMSSDASRLFAVSMAGGVFASTDMGATWTQTTNDTTFWSSFASNSDSSVLIASSVTTYIYASYDYGVSWSHFNGTGNTPYVWTYVDISSDGLVMVAGSKRSTVWVSVDAGASWDTTGDDDTWTSVSLTSDGSTIIGSSEATSSMVRATYTPTDSEAKDKSKKDEKKSKKSSSKGKK